MLILMFFYVFSFVLLKSYSPITSSYLVGLFLSILFFFNNKYKQTVIHVLQVKSVLKIFAFLILIICFSIAIVTLYGTYDFSIIKTLINQMINLSIGLFLFSYYRYKNKQNKIVEHIIYVFILQSIIQFVSFVNPSINELLNVFRSESAIIKGQLDYGMIRGLAVSGPAFFGLGVGYGIVFLLLFSNWNKTFTNLKILRYFAIIFLIFGAVSAARTSIAGLIIGLCYFVSNKFLSKKMYLKKINRLSLFLTPMIVVSLIFLFNFINYDNIISQLERLNNFVFQIFYNYENTGSFTTNSTSTLFNEMYFKVENSTLIFGDGRYTNTDGSYYMNTDGGFMRNILFFGISGTLLLFLYQLYFFKWNLKEQVIENVFFIIYILIVHIKGDVLGFSIMMQSILFLNFLSNINLNHNYLVRGVKDG